MLSRMAQVHYDEMEASQSSCYCTWSQPAPLKETRLLFQLQRVERHPALSSLDLSRLPALIAISKEVLVNCSSHTPGPCCRHPTTVAAPMIPFMSRGQKQKRWALVRATVARENFLPLGLRLFRGKFLKTRATTPVRKSISFGQAVLGAVSRFTRFTRFTREIGIARGFSSHFLSGVSWVF